MNESDSLNLLSIMSTETETAVSEGVINDSLKSSMECIKLNAALAIDYAKRNVTEGEITRFTYNDDEVPFPALVLAPVVHALVEQGKECLMVRYTDDYAASQCRIVSMEDFGKWLRYELENRV